MDPSDTETKVDLQRIEDTLDICNIIVAREHTKMQVRYTVPSLSPPTIAPLLSLLSINRLNDCLCSSAKISRRRSY